LFCPLCNTESSLFKRIQGRAYFQCETCWGIFLDPVNYLTAAQEKARYLEHNNDVEDIGYQNFVKPLVSKIVQFQHPEQKGLDFGAGTGPVITKLLTEQHYNIVTYDPFFANIKKRLETTYDYIVSCEVIEHFHHPAKEFKLLKSLLHKGGSLYCKTHLYNKSIDFDTWYYKDDPTHVFIYQEPTLNWIQGHFGFKELTVESRTIHFKN